ncbi:MAG: phenylalanine 4-monooxygenase, partial [Flavobacteriales bacterium]|nr:phenylalanine 4-monooxygenase [Flavobacteriales bacterium]
KMSQDYRAYTPEDFAVWKTLYNRQIKLLSTTASRHYLDALKTVNFSADAIPNFNELNHILKETTGWSLVVVPNIQPNEIFFPCLAERKFTATTWLRRMDQLDYISEPDMFHDVFGHVPLLSHLVFADFFRQFGELGVKYIRHPQAIEMLGRVYWFTVEFGLMAEEGNTRIFGAGLISSHGESQHCLSDKVERRPFSVREIMFQSYNNSVMQQLYFELPSFETLLHSLGEVEEILAEVLKMRA